MTAHPNPAPGGRAGLRYLCPHLERPSSGAPIRPIAWFAACTHGGTALSQRPSRFVIALMLAALGGAVVLATLTADRANWDIVLLTLLAFSVGVASARSRPAAG